MLKMNVLTLIVAIFMWAAISFNQDVASAARILSASRFTCRGRASGYYADVDTGCQVYHMCDGLGRQFSYSCPNTTLFQQRMLVCDHWYMVNCSKSEQDYDANLLIGQRDKPFVSEADMQLRTPRPDILSVPPNNNYFDGLKEAETKYAVHPSNSIVGVADYISSANDDLAGAKQNYRPPSSWSTRVGVNKVDTNIIDDTQTNNNNFQTNIADNNRALIENDAPTFSTHKRLNIKFKANSPIIHQDNVKSASQEPNKNQKQFENSESPALFLAQNVVPPTIDLIPPLPSSNINSPNPNKLDQDVESEKPLVDPVYQFIRRFDPDYPDSLKTPFTKTEIINLNRQLPSGQSSTEEERSPRKLKNTDNNRNQLQENSKDIINKIYKENRFEKAYTKERPIENSIISSEGKTIAVPDLELKPPKDEYVVIPSTTMGPPIYYEWKWAGPSIELELPNFDNLTSVTALPQKKVITGKSPFSTVTRPPPKEAEPERTEYNISSYFIPDYVFPLDKPHPGYSNENAKTSFQVELPLNGRSFGENPDCPQCHPAFLSPGTCEPCVVTR